VVWLGLGRRGTEVAMAGDGNPVGVLSPEQGGRAGVCSAQEGDGSLQQVNSSAV